MKILKLSTKTLDGFYICSQRIHLYGGSLALKPPRTVKKISVFSVKAEKSNTSEGRCHLFPKNFYG